MKPYFAYFKAAMLVGIAFSTTVQAAPASTKPSTETVATTPPPTTVGIGSAHQVGQFLATPGYLGTNNLPDSLLLNPPPPASGSAAEARDIAASQEAIQLRGTARWDLATRDADVMSPNATNAFSGVVGFDISQEKTPALIKLLSRSTRDFAMVTRPTKQKYNRQRPFMVNGQPTCSPEMDSVLRQDGSYPSGHSAIGFGQSLVLAELLPQKTAEIVARGREFGDSRRICNVHWLSDIEEGRIGATAVFAKLQSNPDFIHDLNAAKSEVARLGS